MTVEVYQIEETANQLYGFMAKVPAQIERLKKEINLCDKETGDLLHLIELSNFHASEGYRLSKDI